MKIFVRSVSILFVVSCLLSVVGLAQRKPSGAPQDDRPSTVKAQPPRAAAKAGGDEAEGDDATARMLAQRKEAGIPTLEFKRKLLQERARRVALEGAARRNGVNGAIADGASVGSGPAWIPIGPDGADYESNGSFTGAVRDSGRARKILPHPTDPDTVYFLASGGGLWVTHNFTSPTTTWTPLTDNLPTTTGGSVAFGRTPTVLYLGLGDPFDVINIGGAMVTSTDGGLTWGPVQDLSAFSVRDILVDSSDPVNDTVLVATDGGLFRSTDSGVTYSPIPVGVPGQVIWSLVQTSAGIIANAQPCVGIGDACHTIGGLYVSTDLGATWAPISNSSGAYNNAGRTSLAVGVPGDSVVYAFAERSDDTDQLDLFRSTNGGMDWTALGLNAKIPTNVNIDPFFGTNTDNPNMDLMHGQAWYNQMILVDPRDPARGTVYLGGNLSSAKTTDGGATWALLSNWLYPALGHPHFGLPYVHADFHAAALSTAGTPTLLFGNDGGIYVSTDEGASWSSDKNNGLQTHLVYTLSSTPGFPANVIGGFQDNGTRVRKGNTLIYNQSLGGDGIAGTWSQGNTNMSITTLPNNSYAATLTNQVPDLSATWFRFGVGAPTGTFSTPVTIPSPAASPSGKVFYTTSPTRLFKVDMGANPPAVSTPATPGLNGIPATVNFRPGPHGLGVSPLDLLHLGIPGTAGHVELTANGGASWTDVSLSAVVSGYVSSNQSFTWVDNNTIFVTSVTPQAGAVHVAKSTDGGVTWAAANTGLPDVQVERIIVDPRDVSKQTLLAATYAGVYRSTDGGGSWAPFGTGLPSVSVRDIYMPPDGSFIRIATYGRGFWELPSLTYVSSTLVDDVNSCNHNGSLDNGETGTLAITLHNDSSATLSSITATITSTNPAVSFPDGNVVSFPPAGANSDTTAPLTVALTGAVGIQQLDFTIAFNDPALSVSSPVTALASFRANYDEVPNSSANDDIEANISPWTVAGLLEAVPDTLNWRRIQISPVEHRWQGIDSNANTDQSLISPTMHVGAGNFTFAFEHRFKFQACSATQGCDGMVLEISTDGGASWTDIGAAASPTYNHQLLPGDDNILQGRFAYTITSTNYPTPFIPVTVNLGTTYAGQDVKIRFRVGSDTFGFAPGVEIRNITTSGLTNTPFTAVVPDSGVCPTTTSITSNNNPSNAFDSVAFGATVSGGLSTATGNVTFNDGGNPIGTGFLDGSGHTSVFSALTAGTHSITASYAGDATHSASNSTTLSQVVQQLGTTTAVTSGLNPAVFGQSIIFFATVNAATSTPTGTVSFFDGASLLGTTTIVGGSAQLLTSTLAVGPHSITASYNGDVNFIASTSAPLSQAVTRATSSVALNSSVSPAAYGQTVSLTATITPQFGGSATGSVTFLDGATPLGSSPVSGNSASLNVSTLTVGSHSLTASYGGDANISGNTSPVVTEGISKATSSVALTSSANPALIAQPVAYTATVAPQFSGVPTGNVTFKQGGITVATVALSGGVATFTTSYASANAGGIMIKANYGGDGRFLTSASSTLKEIVNKNAVAIQVNSDVHPSVFGQTIDFTATLTTAGPTLDGQTVIFKNGTTVLGSSPISGGMATVSTAVLNVGNQLVTALYSGDLVHSQSTGSVLQVVNKASTTTALISSVNPSTFGQTVTFTATVSSATGGTVNFRDGATVIGSTVLNNAGQATISKSTLTVKAHTITAVYLGNTHFLTSTSPALIQTVTAVPSATNSSLTVQQGKIPADGSTAAVILLTLKDASNKPIQGLPVTFTATSGVFDHPSGTTNPSGSFAANLTSTVAGVISVTGTAAGISLNGTVTFVAGSPSAAMSSIVANPNSLPADGSSTSQLTVTLKDANGNPVSGQVVTLSSSGSGNTITPGSGATDASGKFQATISSTVTETKTVTASTGTLTISTSVVFSNTSLCQNVTCTALDQCHDAGTCNPSTGQCSNPAKSDGTFCNDGNACTQIDTCQAGSCVGSAPVVCTASDQCHFAGTCNPSTGACGNPAAPNGTACDDGNLCTQTDYCQAGTCTGTNPVVCTPADECHSAGTCDPSTAQCSNPAVPDGTSCSGGRVCEAGVCQ